MRADSVRLQALRIRFARGGAPLAGAARLASAVLLVLLPKCPLCWAAYAALAASVGLQIESSYAWLVSALYLALSAGVLCLWLLPSRRGALVATLGALLVVGGRCCYDDQPLVGSAGLGLLLTGLVVSLASRRGRRREAAEARSDAPSCC